ncbi:MAG: hypothetical protein EON92_11640 [Burkholderiales bacterium]|nr:MAG: hypothetical protein EON92_11640 [Burkholderiales bacterium]
MIQLATDPNASRSWQAPGQENQRTTFSPQRRGGHAWPFLSRQVGQPVSRETTKPTGDSAS